MGSALSEAGKRALLEQAELHPVREIVVLRDFDPSQERMLREIGEATGCPIVIGLTEGQSLETVDEEGMRSVGWVRRAAILEALDARSHSSLEDLAAAIREVLDGG